MVAKAEIIETDVRGLLMVFWRRRILITAALLIGLSLSSLVLLFVQPKYSGRALLLLDGGVETITQRDSNYALGTGGVPRYDTAIMLSEVEVIRSRGMARGVVERLGLMNDPEFNPKLAAGGGGGEFKTLSVHGSEFSKLPTEMRDRQEAEVISNLLGNLNVRQIPGSGVIQLEFTSLHAAKAALIANSFADAYIELSLADDFAASQKLAEWLEKRVAALRTEVQAREVAVQNYKAENNIYNGTTTLLSAEQTSAMNQHLAAARGGMAEAEARLLMVGDLLNAPGKMDSADAVLDSGVIQKLKLEQARMEADLSEMSSRYGPKHPDIVKLKSEIAETENAIRKEIQTIGRSIENELYFSQARVAALEQGLAESGGRFLQDDERMIGLRALELEAESARLVLESFLKNEKSGGLQEELQNPSARVISYASLPRGPSRPNKRLIVSLSTIVALFAGLALALLMEKLDNSFRSAGQLEAALDLPCFALVPSAGKIKAPYLARYALAKPSSPVAESVRTLRMVLNLRASNEKPKVVTMTSSFPGEGKTTLSLWLARLSAQSGEKVIVVDADLRRPNIHRSAGVGNDVTIVDYLIGAAALDKIIRKDTDSPAHMIFARSVPAGALDLLGTKRMKDLVTKLREDYDLVIIDSPAALAVSDARLLATLSDVVLYAVRWDRTPREVVASGVKHFADMGYGALALVLTNVDVKRHARYGYGDSMHYYGRYKEMYAAE